MQLPNCAVKFADFYVSCRCSRDRFLQEHTDKTYTVEMGFGLHYGWAIEGAVGSSVKVDATYLSPHVNMSARLEAATAQYFCSVLVSEALYRRLSPEYERWMYKVDNVVLVGTSRPTVVYAYDDHQDEGDNKIHKKTRFAAEYEQAIDYYIQGDWADATKCFHTCLAERPQHQGVEAMLKFFSDERERCGGDLNAMGAPREWKGYRVLSRK
eukprot:SAG11_NODE_665_length_7847_cov_13.635132_4_plen_211_part_00